ncbi:MAG: rane fusion protein YbhG [Thermoanaerobaculia bacterium]|nr:rane fusion protein YbhG [Thermoanaerobaculia bacterium]
MAAGKRAPIRIILALIVIAVIVAASLLYWRESHKPKEIVLSGSLEARTVNVGSLIGGRVTKTLIDEGTTVVAGQLLVTLETDTIDRQLSEQRAAIKEANAALAKALAGPRPEEIATAAAIASNAAVEQRRWEKLYRYGIVAKEIADDAATKAKTAANDLRVLQEGTRKEDIDAARAAVEAQQRRLDTLMKTRAETNVVSTVSGFVQSFGLRVGDIVAPNQTVAEILESSQLWVRVYVPETELGLVTIGHPVRVLVDTFPNDSFAGHVASVSNQGEYTPRNVQTRAQRAEQVFGVKILVDPNPKLKAGMAASVDLGVKGTPD